MPRTPRTNPTRKERELGSAFRALSRSKVTRKRIADMYGITVQEVIDILNATTPATPMPPEHGTSTMFWEDGTVEVRTFPHTCLTVDDLPGGANNPHPA